jgi:hypothetical protein
MEQLGSPPCQSLLEQRSENRAGDKAARGGYHHYQDLK